VVKVPDTAKYLCVAVANVTGAANDTAPTYEWIYINVNVNTKNSTSIYKENFNFTDYGTEAQPVRTDYQKKEGLDAGYTGPINRNSIANILISDFSPYEVQIFTPAYTVIATDEASALKHCGTKKAVLTFKSKYATHVVAALALVLAAIF
jgi:hypothetical protein